MIHFFVEGGLDLNFISQVLEEYYNLRNRVDFVVHDCKGKNNIKKQIKAYRSVNKKIDNKNIIIVVDHDNQKQNNIKFYDIEYKVIYFFKDMEDMITGILCNEKRSVDKKLEILESFRIEDINKECWSSDINFKVIQNYTWSQPFSNLKRVLDDIFEH